jgi:spermidine/putrescine transport system permease protein
MNMDGQTSPAYKGGGISGFFMRNMNARGYVLLSPTLLLLTFAMLAPICVLVGLSFWTQSGMIIEPDFSFHNYMMFFEKPIFAKLLGRSLWVSGSVAFLTVLLAYPAAYFVAFKVKKNKLVWLILITVPFWTSYLLRVFAWKIVLGYNGVINSGLMNLGLIDKPMEFMLYNTFAVVLTLAHAWAAFAILPIYVSLEKIDRSLLEAAADLGENKVMSFLRVTLPLSAPGVIAATLLVFIPTVGDFVTPKLVGGSGGILIGNMIQTMFGRGNNWPMGAAISVVTMITITLVVCCILWSIGQAKKRASRG